MGAMPMPDGEAMSMNWMPMCGQSWIAAAGSFLGMWTIMMAAMMLPSLAPALWRYRRSVGGAGRLPPPLLIALVAGGYFLVWALLGAVIFPVGAATSAAVAQHPVLARCAPIASALIVLIAGVLQLTRWKAHHLTCCRQVYRHESLERGRALPANAGARRPGNASSAWRYGLRLGLHCSQCCAGLTAALLVTGIMDWPAMLAVTVAINLERLAPGGGRIARAIGLVTIAAGSFLTVRAAGL
jgi:predicted metal-binding membrane protein